MGVLLEGSCCWLFWVAELLFLASPQAAINAVPQSIERTSTPEISFFFIQNTPLRIDCEIIIQ
jgi:hypothetical protein